MPLLEESYQCPSCGRILRRADVLRQEWGSKADEYLYNETLAKAGDVIWAFALENFKALHECEPEPTDGEIRQKWPKLAFRKLLRYSITGSVVLLIYEVFSGTRVGFSGVKRARVSERPFRLQTITGAGTGTKNWRRERCIVQIPADLT